MLVFLAGIGIAAYHPEGAKFAAYASGRKRASGMSYFNIGGNTGYALGPIVVTPLVRLARARGRRCSRCCPCSSVALVLLRALPRARARSCPAVGAPRAVEGRDDVRAMALLGVVIALRSVAWFGLLTFVPLWVVANGGSEGEGGRELSLMLVAGAIGTLVLGPVADRVGLRRTLVVTQAALPVPDRRVRRRSAASSGTVALMLVGLCVVGTFGITMVLSQLYLPRHVGMASGLSVGLAMGLGGVAAVALGAVADAIDLETALYVGRCGTRRSAASLCLLLPSPVAWEPLPEPVPAASSRLDAAD